MSHPRSVTAGSKLWTPWQIEMCSSRTGDLIQKSQAAKMDLLGPMPQGGLLTGSHG